mmetsp:Transcript_29188/g.56395  ORF Transcript_29188/g.56395 Transcript_29188/m.56395 type:complete len:243 (-) Transcript_29188:2936-3664(-)
MAHFADGVNDQGQLHRKRTFDEDHVTTVQTPGYVADHLGGGVEPVAPFFGGQRAVQMLHQRADAVDFVDLVHRFKYGQIGVHVGPLFAQFLHVAHKRNPPSFADPANVVCHLGGGQHIQRRGHRGRVGIVAVINQFQRHMRFDRIKADHLARAAPLIGRPAAQALRGQCQIGPQRLAGGQGPQPVHRIVLAHRPDFEEQRLVMGRGLNDGRIPSQINGFQHEIETVFAKANVAPFGVMGLGL